MRLLRIILLIMPISFWLIRIRTKQTTFKSLIQLSGRLFGTMEQILMSVDLPVFQSVQEVVLAEP